MKKLIFPVIALMLTALACNAASGAPPTSAGDRSTPTSRPTLVPPTAMVDPVAICPKATADSRAYVNQDNGVCFLYPNFLKPPAPDSERPRDVAAFVGPPLDPNAPQSPAVYISVSINGPDEGMTSQDYARKWMQAGANPNNTLDSTTVAGAQVEMVKNMEGLFRQQVAFVIANGYRYTITLGPRPGDFEGLDAQVNQAWKTVTESIVFFPPGVPRTEITPDQACPKPGPDTALHVALREGACFLVPLSFRQEKEVANGFQGGPQLGELFGRPLYAELVFGDAGPAEGKTPRQLWEPRLVNKDVSKIDVAGAQDVTMNGFPALVWTEGAPLASRQAIVVANDHQYTLVNQPYHDPNVPGGTSDVDLVWNTVSTSLAFFTPFQ